MYYWVSSRSQFCMYIHVYVSAHVCICIWRPKDKFRSQTLGAIHLVLWDKVSLGWNSLIRLSWMANMSQRSVCLYLPSTGTASSCHHTSFFFNVCSSDQTQVLGVQQSTLLTDLFTHRLSVFKHDQLTDFIIFWVIQTYFSPLELIWKLLLVQYLCLLIRIGSLM